MIFCARLCDVNGITFCFFGLAEGARLQKKYEPNERYRLAEFHFYPINIQEVPWPWLL